MDTLKKLLLSLALLLAFAACGSIKELKDSDGIAYEEIDAPDAYVVNLPPSEIFVNYLPSLSAEELVETNVALDAMCSFNAWPGDPPAEIPELNVRFDDWPADFVVSFDRPVADETVALFGCMGDWIGFPLPGLGTGESFRMVQTMFVMSVPYAMIYSGLSQFPCGALNLSPDNYGTTINVELRLFEVDDEGEETGNYVTVTNFVYTFRDPSAQSVSPTRSQTVTAADQSAAESAAALLPIEAANDDAAAAGQVDVLKRVVKSNGDGTYTVSVTIDEEKIVSPDETLAAFGAAASAGLSDVASAEDGETVSLSLPKDKATPGLYYSLAVATKLDFSDEVESPRVLATSEGLVEVLSITKPTSGTAFIKVKVNMVPPPTNE